MTPYRKYIFSIAMLFVIPTVILAAMGNDLAWMFGIIGGMLTIGALGMDETLTPAEEYLLDRRMQESLWQASDPTEPDSINYYGYDDHR